MYLQHLSLLNFKNICQAELRLEPGINCFVGNNGTGKTNLLDAIYYLSFCKSYFNPVDSQLMHHDKDFFVIQGQFMRQEQEENIYAGLKLNQKKRFKRNQKEYPKLSDHIGLLPLVMITPGDERLITDASDQRRKFIDSVISQFDKSYLELIIRYNRILIQRNSLLKSANGNLGKIEVQLDVWDEQLSMTGASVYQKRIEFIHQLEPVFQNYYSFISGGNEAANIKYQSHLEQGDLLDQLVQRRSRDTILGYTTRGVHRDDLELLLNNFPVKKDGSQGQKKTFLMALKFAQYEFLRNFFGFSPVLLLDDIFDKLDEQRGHRLVELVGRDSFNQIFITDTQKQRLHHVVTQTGKEYLFFNVDNGDVKPEIYGDEK